MPNIKQLSRTVNKLTNGKTINWFPGHMFSGMQAMMGKLNTVDCVVEVHDARIPFTGRNAEFCRHLGRIKPRLLVLNKSDLADLSRWDAIKRRLKNEGDENVFLTDLTGSQFSFMSRGYSALLENVIRLVNQSNRFNRVSADNFKIMIVGIPNVGKSTLINRLRQHHIGKKGQPARTGSQAGVTRHVENVIKICSRPPIYSIDTPGVLQPGTTKDDEQAMRLALCSTINDVALDPMRLAQYLLDFLNEDKNYSYQDQFGLERPARYVQELYTSALSNIDATETEPVKIPSIEIISWRLIRDFRRGLYGRVMFD